VVHSARIVAGQFGFFPVLSTTYSLYKLIARVVRSLSASYFWPHHGAARRVVCWSREKKLFETNNAPMCLFLCSRAGVLPVSGVFWGLFRDRRDSIAFPFPCVICGFVCTDSRKLSPSLLQQKKKQPINTHHVVAGLRRQQPRRDQEDRAGRARGPQRRDVGHLGWFQGTDRLKNFRPCATGGVPSIIDLSFTFLNGRSPTSRPRSSWRRSATRPRSSPTDSTLPASSTLRCATTTGRCTAKRYLRVLVCEECSPRSCSGPERRCHRQDQADHHHRRVRPERSARGGHHHCRAPG